MREQYSSNKGAIKSCRTSRETGGAVSCREIPVVPSVYRLLHCSRGYSSGGGSIGYLWSIGCLWSIGTNVIIMLQFENVFEQFVWNKKTILIINKNNPVSSTRTLDHTSTTNSREIRRSSTVRTSTVMVSK